MKKIKLDIDSLRVDTFVTGGSFGSSGTVFGMANTVCEGTCGGSPTCDGGIQCDDSDPAQECKDYTNPEMQSCTGGGGGQTTDCSADCQPDTIDEPTCADTCEDTCDVWQTTCNTVPCEPE